MRNLVAVSCLLWMGSSAVAGDLSLIQELVGTHPVLEWNGDSVVAGTIKVIGDESGIGYQTEGLPLAVSPVSSMQVLSPKDPTTLERVGNVITQKYSVAGGANLLVEYKIFNGYFEVTTHSCRAEGACERASIVATMGGAPGENLDAKSFLGSLKGSYKIKLAGGHAPKESVNTADVDVDTDPTETGLYVPYCWPSGACDIGYVPLPYAETSVYKRAVSDGHNIYVFLRKSGSKLYYFAWEEKLGLVTFHNYQYVMDKQRVYLEHVMEKLN